MAMKSLILACAVVSGAGAKLGATRHFTDVGTVATKTEIGDAKVAVDAKTVELCASEFGTLFDSPLTKSMAIERVADKCALDKRIDDKNFVCPHFREFLTNAFSRESTTELFTAASFCQITETYAKQIQTAAYVPNVGSGTGFNFMVSDKCQPTVNQALAPHATLTSSEVPDFWYSLCTSQDCAHFLPSRTRWCTKTKGISHSTVVCEGVRRFAKDEVSVTAGGAQMNAAQICEIYGEYMKETNIDLEAYMVAVHHVFKHNVASPDDQARALGSSQMINDAAGHHLRDNEGNYVAPMKSSALTRSMFGLQVLGGYLILAVFGF